MQKMLHHNCVQCQTCFLPHWSLNLNFKVINFLINSLRRSSFLYYLKLPLQQHVQIFGHSSGLLCIKVRNWQLRLCAQQSFNCKCHISLPGHNLVFVQQIVPTLKLVLQLISMFEQKVRTNYRLRHWLWTFDCTATERSRIHCFRHLFGQEWEWCNATIKLCQEHNRPTA